MTSLVFGAVLSVLGVSFLVAAANDADVDLTWLLAATLIAVGAVALAVGAARSVRGRPQPVETGADEDA